ncbi:hypothetical protein LRP88_03905 [Fusarium phalaenopsidis]
MSEREYYKMTFDNSDHECAWCEEDIEAGEEHWIEEMWFDNGPSLYHYHDDCYDEYMEEGSDDDEDEDEDDDEEDDYEGSDEDDY